MVKRFSGVLLVGFPLIFSSAAVAADAMKPGLWEITTSIEMPGMPYQPPAQSMRHCYTPEEVKEEPVPMNDECTISEMKHFGNKTTWKMVCKGEMAGTGEGEFIYQGDSAYEGKTKVKAEGMTVTTKYKGKRIGECK